jgi:cellulose synthase/poly-beta-1,6-N-acetylglucosamine synthase-like glycosyltransferase
MLLAIVGSVIVAVLLIICLWGLYNVPILATGVQDFRKNRQKQWKQIVTDTFLPTFSIIVPVKNEEKVIGRLLDALSKLNYPASKQEIVIVEDGSTDTTFDICAEYAKAHAGVKILQRAISNGKPSALNFGLAHSKGGIIAVFDADNVPDVDALMAVCRYFEDPTVGAVQGKTVSINPKENMLTQFISYEEAVWCEAYLRGKDVLNLFVHLKGSCQFIRRGILEKLAGFSEDVLSEDMEIAARLTENDYRIRYASDVVAWQESPSTLKTLFKQRTRWFRGTMEVAFKYGRLMSKPSRLNFDVEATLFGPFVLIASLMPYLAVFYAFFTVMPFSFLWGITVQFAVITTTVTMLLCGFALIYVTRPRRVKNLLWLPFVYLYWSLQAFIALYAALLILFRRPRVWGKTSKSGVVTVNTSLEGGLS